MNYRYNCQKLYKLGGYAAFVIVSIIPIQIIFSSIFHAPVTALGFIDLFHTNWILGLLSLDFLYYVNNILLILFYIGLFAALRKVDFASMFVALIIGFIGIASYYASCVGFEMMSISNQYFLTESDELKKQLLNASIVLIAKYKGTSFDVYYVLNAITLMIISKVMFKSKSFGKVPAIWGLISGILMVIPSTAGTIGLMFSFASLIPGFVFYILSGKKLLTKSFFRYPLLLI